MTVSSPSCARCWDASALPRPYGGGLVCTVLVPRNAVLMTKRALFTHEIEFVVDLPADIDVCVVEPSLHGS
jgi:hypothetical protein